MALGDINLLSWKSKEQQQREQEEYEKWAFPYGTKQRGALVKLMLEVFPKENEQTTLIAFLTCKELFQKACKTPDMVTAAIEKMLTDVKQYKRLVRKKDMPYYLALVLADKKISADCVYPTAQEIITTAEGFTAGK